MAKREAELLYEALDSKKNHERSNNGQVHFYAPDELRHRRVALRLVPSEAYINIAHHRKVAATARAKLLAWRKVKYDG